ncbi:hypothetical protein [Streptomyces sp. NPDC127084]
MRDKAGALWWFRGTGIASRPLGQRSYGAPDSYPYTAWMQLKASVR